MQAALIKGITLKEYNIIKTILEQYKNKYEFYFYGSRVRGNFRPLSDLDILVKSKNNIDLNDIDNIKTFFDESTLPYVVNLSYELDEDFYKLIEKDLVKI